jgi:hypothetical protein
MHRNRLAAAPLLLLMAGCTFGSHTTMPTGPEATLVGSGRFVTESRPVGIVTEVVATAAIRATVTHADAPSLDILAEDNVLPFVDAVERAGVLTLGMKPSPGGLSTHGVEVRVGLRELKVADASGAARIDADAIAAGDFVIKLSGASQFNGSGSVGRLHLDISGASRIQAPGLAADVVTATISGASTGVVRIGRSLVAAVSGSSLLEFFGNPSVDAAVSDTSVVRRIGP